MNEVEYNAYKKPEDYQTRNIIYSKYESVNLSIEMNKDKVFNVNWKMGDDGVRQTGAGKGSRFNFLY